MAPGCHDLLPPGSCGLPRRASVVKEDYGYELRVDQQLAGIFPTLDGMDLLVCTINKALDAAWGEFSEDD